jgi:hypothetical protein
MDDKTAEDVFQQASFAFAPQLVEVVMRRARAFFYVCAGIFLLALSYHLGAATATAQAPGNPIVTALPTAVITANGDVYTIPGNEATFSRWSRCGNVFAGGPTPASQATWGQLKASYRK